MIQEGDSHQNHYDQQTSPIYGIALAPNTTIRPYSHDPFFITTAAPVALVRQLSTVLHMYLKQMIPIYKSQASSYSLPSDLRQCKKKNSYMYS
ncbi:hypothetical protein CHS0354_005890 [Potamilus streckersoni]|uniref:Uncharacterized protein n=1 Tax=Potamilus streckersoni TaxID=2493646 RepID=A0AAE0T8X8_9BIVA|nr:hypothetical protein CHS0354_005890 [Potamilus streckersoni]